MFADELAADGIDADRACALLKNRALGDRTVKLKERRERRAAIEPAGRAVLDDPTLVVVRPRNQLTAEDLDYSNSATERLTCNYSGEDMEIAFNSKFISEMLSNLDTERVIRKYRMPLSELIVDFYDKLKSNTKGYGTMNYEFVGYEAGDLLPLDIYINGDPIEAFRMIVHKDKAFYVGRDIVSKLKDLIPKHQFVIPIQAGIGTKMIARETISAMRKDVIAKCYGGDVTRKRKLLEKQKEGKKKMKAMGSVNVPSDVFMKMIQND
jgi:GTP-binding protein LepA